MVVSNENVGLNDVPVWHLRMMNDQMRNRVFRTAISRAVKPGSRVLDVGAGSGLLAMYAAKAGADKIVAFEANPRIAQVTREIISRNGFADKIELLSIHSDDFHKTRLGEETLLSETNKFDVLISETIGDGILNEKIVDNIGNMKKYLKPGAAIIPHGIEFCVCPVDMTGIRECFEVANVDGFDLSAFNSLFLEVFGTWEPIENWRQLCVPVTTPPLSFSNFPPNATINFQFQLEKNGVCDGFLIWANVILDQDLRMSTMGSSMRDSWRPLFWKTDRRALRYGDKINCVLSVLPDRLNLRWNYPN